MDQSLKAVLRITRHELDEGRLAALKDAFGDDVRVVTEDVRFGDDPVAAIRTAMDELGDVVAIELVAPFPVLMKIVDGRRRLDDVPILRAQFRRGQDGRAVVAGQDASGRDILAFSHYEELVRIVFETRAFPPA